MKQLKITNSITDHSDESVAAYFSSISKRYMISPEEEIELARKIKNGDQKALNTLVCANLRFVVSVAKQYQNRGLELSDLISEGNIGLIKAAEKFDESHGAKFISYAVWFIRQSIMEALTTNSRMIRLPQEQVKLWSRIKDYQESFEKEKHRIATLEEIASGLEISIDKIQHIFSAVNGCYSLDAPLQEDGDATFEQLYNAAYDTAADAHLDAESDKIRLEQLFQSTLHDREIFIIRHSFGIDCEELTQEEMAQMLGISRERVRQLREQALLKMKVFGRYRLCS